MDMERYLKELWDENEQPLDRMPADGGFCGIFRSYGCVGDSLSSGEFEGTADDGSTTYHDLFDYSWGQYFARLAGTTVRNFSRGGMTAKEYCESFAAANGYWDEDKVCSAYIFALGVNDLYGQNMELGSLEDICMEDPEQNKPTFAGYYCRILQKLKQLQPEARFFLMTMPRETQTPEMAARGDAHAALLYAIAAAFPNCYVLDLRKYGPEYTSEFKRAFYLGGHMNPCGYLFTAKLVASYIDYIIRHNMTDFKQSGFIGTPYQNTKD